MLRAFVVTVIAAAVCALLSCWLVLLAKAIGRVPLPGATGTLAGVMMTAEEARGRRRQVSTILCRLDPDAQLITDHNPADDKDN